MTDREAPATDTGWLSIADRLTAVIESRMSRDLAWLDDDGKTVIRLNPEEAGAHIAHLYMTGDVVSGLPPIEAEASVPAAPLTAEALAEALRAEGFVRGVATRYGRFNDVYWEQSAEAILARLPAAPAALTYEDGWNDARKPQVPGKTWRREAAPAAPQPDEALRAALERTLANFEGLLARKPVRDAAETIAEARKALAARSEHEHVWDTWTSTVIIDSPTSEPSPLVRSCGICGTVRPETEREA